MMQRNKTKRARRLVPLVLAGMVLGGCSDDLFQVVNPGRILDEDLNDARIIPALVTGMSRDFAIVMDNNAFDIARLSDEAAGSGSYYSTGLLRRGIAARELFDYNYQATHRARWVAETGIERMKQIEGYQFEGNPRTARAYLFAGLSNRVLGELFCEVTYDGSAVMPRTAAFERAIPQFEAAVQHARQAKETEFELAALGGLAQAYVGLGNWARAAEFAAQVPTRFEHLARYDDNNPTNIIYNETHQRHEISAFQTFAAQANDPRAPFTDCTASGTCKGSDKGADGTTPHFRQEKYPERGSDIPVVKGTEMRLIEAEAALERSDIMTAMEKINEVRTFHDLEPRAASTAADAREILMQERYLTLWLEGRRLFDLDRWDHPFLRGGSIVYEGESQRARCLPLPETECDTNPNANCSPTG